MHRAGNADFVEKRENVPCLGVSSGGNFRGESRVTRLKSRIISVESGFTACRINIDDAFLRNK